MSKYPQNYWHILTVLYSLHSKIQGKFKTKIKIELFFNVKYLCAHQLSVTRRQKVRAYTRHARYVQPMLLQCLRCWTLQQHWVTDPLVNPLGPHDALKHQFTSLKTDLIFLQQWVLEQNSIKLIYLYLAIFFNF